MCICEFDGEVFNDFDEDDERNAYMQRINRQPNENEIKLIKIK